MIAKVLKRSGNVAVVSYLDERGMVQGRIISIDRITDAKIGHQLDVPVDAISNGIEYGIDWTIVFPDHVVSLVDLQQSMRNHGVWTEADMLSMPKEMVSAINAMSAAIYAKMIRYAQEALGDKI